MHKKWVILVGIVIALIIIGRVVSGSYLSPKEDVVLEYEPVGPITEDVFVRVTNTSPYPVAPGPLVIHNRQFSMDFLGRYAPGEYELLAEVGDPSVFIASLDGNPAIYEVLEVGLLEPNTSETFTVSAANPDALISYMAMIVPTNDGVVWLNGFPLYGQGGKQQHGGFIPEIVDMGTEQNSPIGSGFEGGQPDPSRGDENLENGTVLRETVYHHPQFYDDPAVSTELVRIDLNS